MASKRCAREYLHLIFLFIICVQVQRSKSDGDLRWVKHTGDAHNLPADAIVGGYEQESSYIARAGHEGSLTPGKYFPSSNRAVISWGSRTHNTNELEVLCGTNYKWVFATTDNIPAGSFVGGRTEIVSDPLYICRTNYSGHLILGKVQQSLGACLIAYTGQELRTRLFEILVATEKTSSSVDVNPHWVKYQGSLPADAIVGGFENEILYVGRAMHGGSFTPGKFIPSTGKLVISWGFKTHEKDKDIEILCGTNYKWTALRTYDIPDDAVDAGIQNHPVFVGRANYSGHVIPGKINIEVPYVVVPYGTKEYRTSNLEVLIATGENGEGDPYWVKYDRNTHEIPPDAIVAGFENENLYIARADENGTNIGKFVPSLQKAFIPRYKSIAKEEFEILCGKNYKWVKPTKKRMPDRAIVAGRYENTQPLYIGRGTKDGHLIPGKALKDRSWCLIAFKGYEIFLREEYYEILLIPPKSNVLDQFSPKPNKNPPADCKPTLTKVHNGVACAGQILFEDTFDRFRDDLWQIEQYIPIHSTEFPFVSYQRLVDNPTVSVMEGNLHITPKLQQQMPGFSDASIFTGTLNLLRGCTASHDACSKQAWGASILPPIVSGRITSKGFAFIYGTVHVRAKLPQGDWLYPEILLQPLLMKYGSVHHSSGVIKIASARGNKELNSGSSDYSNKVLYGGAIMDSQCQDLLLTDRLSNNGVPWGDDFHEYSMKWTPDNIILSVDGVEWARIEPATSGLVGRFPRVCGELPRQLLHAGTKLAPFDDYFYLTLGVGAGSVIEFPDNIRTSGGHEKPWSNPSSKAMLHFWEDIDAWLATWNEPQLLVDYIKVVAL